MFPPGELPASLSKQQSSLCEIRLLDLDGNEVARFPLEWSAKAQVSGQGLISHKTLYVW